MPTIDFKVNVYPTSVPNDYLIVALADVAVLYDHHASSIQLALDGFNEASYHSPTIKLQRVTCRFVGAPDGPNVGPIIIAWVRPTGQTFFVVTEQDGNVLDVQTGKASVALCLHAAIAAMTLATGQAPLSASLTYTLSVPES
jgi:hypothetical protein